MKKMILVCFLAVVFSSASCAVVPASFVFNGVPLMMFAQATYKNILGRDYVISSELVSLDKRITINVKELAGEKIPAFVDSLMLSQGIKSELRDGVYYLDVVKVSGVVAPVALVVSSPGAVVSGVASSGVVSGVAAVDPVAVVSPVVLVVPDRVAVFVPQNRPVDFMVSVLNSAFGVPVARAAGRQLVIAAPDNRVEVILKLAADLDEMPKTVEVSASFVEVSTSGSNSRGVSLVASVLSKRFGVSVLPGAGSVGVSGGSYQLVIDALNADGRFKQVSNSRVVGDDAERMTLSVGEDTPTLASTGKDNQGNAIQSIVYRPSGVILDVLPRVMGSGKLSLLVDGQVSSFQSTVNGVSGSPTLVKRQVKTSVSVGDGQVLVIGGLDDTKALNNTAGFSFLPATWANKSGTNSHTDLVLILSAKTL